MATIALFGITGKTGGILVTKLLENNFQVKALVRNPTKVKIKSPGLTIIYGNILNEHQVRETITGVDLVVNVIGHVKGCAPDLQTVASQKIIAAMKECGIRRLINLTGGGVKIEGDRPGFIDRSVNFVMKNLIGKAMRHRMIDGDNHVEIIRESGLDWTIVRAPVLLNKPAKGKVKVGMVGYIPGHSLTYEDLCDEMVKIITDNLYLNQFPYITNG